MRITSERRTFIRARALERFRHYVTTDPRSDPESQRHPLSEGRWDLAGVLRKESNAMEEGIRVQVPQKSTEVLWHLCRFWSPTSPPVPSPPAAAPEFDENKV